VGLIKDYLILSYLDGCKVAADDDLVALNMATSSFALQCDLENEVQTLDLQTCVNNPPEKPFVQSGPRGSAELEVS